MYRRQLLVRGGFTIPISLGGCVQAPRSDGGTPSGEVPVTITSQADQPAVPVEYGVEMVRAGATNDEPAILRVSITNPTDATVVVGEERDIKFHHVSSTDETVYLYPTGDAGNRGPVVQGCWQLTEYVAVPEYYGTVTLSPGETGRAESYVYGHPELPAETCLPAGEHRLVTTGVAGDTEADVTEDEDATEFEWGFMFQIGE